MSFLAWLRPGTVHASRLALADYDLMRVVNALPRKRPDIQITSRAAPASATRWMYEGC